MKPPFRSSHIPTRVLLATLFFLLAAALETAQAQVVTLSSASLSFGSVAVGTTSPPRTVTLRNTSTTTALSIPSIPGIVASGNFAQTNTCGTSVAAGGRCVITVTFTPTALGASTGSIVITDNASPATQTIALTGTGVTPITITPASHNFGSVGEGTTSAAYNFTVRNYQNTAAALTISGPAAPFAQTNTAQTNTCGTSLAANSTCSISVTFSPTTTTAGAQTGSLTVAQGTSSPVTATLTGTGVLPITITPASRAFGSVAQGYTSAARTFTVQNHTTAAVPLTISSPNTAFVVTGCGAPGASVAANASCTLSVTFAPTTATPPGAQTGSIVVAYTGTGNPQSVTVTGTAVTPLTAQPTAITFSTMRAVGTPSLPHSVTITNGATSPVAIGSIVASPAAYAITGNTCGGSLNAAASCTVTVVFTPTVVGTTTGTLTITYGTANSQLVVPMTGGAQVNNLLSLVITAPSPSLTVGASEQLTATGTYGNGTSGNVTSAATWTSSNTGVATVVSNTGVVTAVAPGTTTITAAVAGTNNGTVQNTFTLTVPKVLVSITVAPAGVTLGLNGTQQFTATGTYSDGTTANVTQTATTTWASSNTAVVKVNSTGLATVVSTPTPDVAVAVTASSGTIASNTAWVSTSTTLPATCPSPTIDMKLLVVDNKTGGGGGPYADVGAIKQILDYIGTPYKWVDVSESAPPLSDGACHGYYQGVIFAYGGDYYSIGAWQQKLISYEQTFKVRHLNWYSVPDPNFGLSLTGTPIPSTQSYTTSFTSAAGPVFFYANTTTPLTITNAAVDLASAAPAAGGTVTPLLQDGSGNIVSAIYDNGKGQTFLSQTFDSNPYLTHDLVLAYGLLNWVTKSVFLGDYHVYASQQVDDFFIDDSEWIPSTPCLTNPLTQDRTAPDASNLPVFRVNTADMTQLVAWQTGIQNDPSGLFSQFKLTMAFNGVGTAGNGDWTGLTAPVTSTSATNGLATFTSPGLSALPGEQVTVTGTHNSSFSGTFTIISVTSNATTTPGTTIFTANLASSITASTVNETGATATIPDDLSANLQSYQSNFHWISHTYDHPSTLNGLTKSGPADANGDTIDLEVLANLWVAGNASGVDPRVVGLKQLNFTDFNPANMVTPGITGLNDTGVPGYLNEDGIQFVVTDTSVIGQANNGPNPSPNVGIVNSFAPGIYEVPRYPNDIFYNAANWADDQAEFVCIYSHYVPPNSPPGTVPAPDPPFNTFNAAQILDFTSLIFVNNMLMGDMNPQMFHQPDLHFADNYPALTATPFGPPNPPVTIPGLVSPHVSSLISDTYDLTFSKYKALYKLPVLSPTLDQLGVLMQNRNSFNLSGVTASILAAGTASAQITITMPSTATIPTAGCALQDCAVIPVTGLTSTGSEMYGGQNISHINMTPGTTIQLPLP